MCCLSQNQQESHLWANKETHLPMAINNNNPMYWHDHRSKWDHIQVGSYRKGIVSKWDHMHDLRRSGATPVQFLGTCDWSFQQVMTKEMSPHCQPLLAMGWHLFGHNLLSVVLFGMLYFSFIIHRNIFCTSYYTYFQDSLINWCKMVYFLIGHYTYRMFPPAIDIIPTSLAVVYSNGKYTNYKN